MSFYEAVRDKEMWLAFKAEEEEKEFKDEKLIKRIDKIVEQEKYNKFDASYFANFPLAKIKRIGAYNTSKKRIVYVYPRKDRDVLKFMAYYILKRYNGKFAKNSIAYTKGRSVRTAFKLLKDFKIGKDEKVYKNDFSDYFNSIDIEKLEPKLKRFLGKDIDLCLIILSLLKEERVRDGKEIVRPVKGVMAGSPISGILANIFMDDLDKRMLRGGHRYIRYADDTLIIGKDSLDYFVSEIEKLGIAFNHKKTKVYTLETGITFLGFKHVGKIIDVSDKAKDKMKSRLKRRAKWYRQWMLRKNVKKETAVRDYIKKINFKLFSDQEDSINWSRWYLPNINTGDTLHYLDKYYVRAIRFIWTGIWIENERHYALSYEKIKELGFKSLVNEYYKLKKQKTA